MKPRSPKQRFLTKDHDDEQDIENLLLVDKSEYNPSAEGDRMHRSPVRTRIVKGGLGGGKSRSVGEDINALALTYPGSRFLIGRYDLPALRRTTQHEFLEKVVDSRTVDSFNVNDNVLYYKNSAEVHFVQVKTPDDFKSFEGVGAFIDEADENPYDTVWNGLNQRLRQRIHMPDGSIVTPPYRLYLVFNPTDDQHWLYQLAHRAGLDMDVFTFPTTGNLHNLPEGYLEELQASIPPWDHGRLIHGNWGRQIKGKPVIHGFDPRTHVRPCKVNERWPILRGWDFGFNHPAVKWIQIDPMTGRTFHLREFLGNKQYLHASYEGKPSVVDSVKQITSELVGPNYPIIDFCDPHGADKKDNAESSVDYLRRVHNIHCRYTRTQITLGVDEIQHRVSTRAPFTPEGELQATGDLPLWVVDPSCTVTIGAYTGGYYRDEQGYPVKDGYFDHIVDVDRYIVVHNMNLKLARDFAARKKRHVPRNSITGY